MDAFLAAAHRAIALERETDEAQRAVHQALVAEARASGAALFVVVELTRAFEEAADALMHSAHLLREHTLTRVVALRGRRPAPGPRRPRPPPRVRRATASASMSTCSAIRRSRSLTRA